MSDIKFGKDGHLFLLDSIHSIYKHLAGNMTPSESSVLNFYKNIEERENYCKNKSIKYKHVVYPDKLSVLWNFAFDGRPATYTSHYKPYFSDSVIDLHDFLSRHNPENLFFKTDTHLNFEGKLLTSLEIMSHFNSFDYEEKKDDLKVLKGDKFSFFGDLGSKVSPMIEEERFNIVNRNIKRFNNQVGANDGLAIICLNKKLLRENLNKRLLIFGDSFCERSLLFFGEFYSEILFCRSRYFHNEIADMFQPNHIITESAERYFSSVRLDLLAHRFNLIYGLRGFKYSENQDFYRAFNAVLNFGRPEYSRFIYNFINGI